ncbi:MAG: hypothetical protein WC673_00745 [Candidatus Paceibacterota bacterium]
MLRNYTILFAENVKSGGRLAMRQSLKKSGFARGVVRKITIEL